MSQATFDNFQAIILAAGCSRRLAHLTQHTPKSLLKIEKEKCILDYHFDMLKKFSIREVIMVVGHLKERLSTYVLEKYPDFHFQFVESDDYASTGHSWSLHQTKKNWEKDKRPVILIHADTYLSQNIYFDLMHSPHPNVILADVNFELKTFDEVVVTGQSDTVQALIRGPKQKDHLIGEFIGLHKFNADCLNRYYDFSHGFIQKFGKNEHYEQVLSEFIKATGYQFNYLKIEEPWVNINYEEDLNHARSL